MEEMSELFYRDSYCREFTAAVTECFPYKGHYAVVLEDTAFYPEGGGQPGDRGTLNGIEVFDTCRREGKILHICAGPLEPGTEAEGKLDWKYRFDNMQSHTGEHVFSGLVHRRFGYENVGFHMGREMITLDFDGPFSFEEALEIERTANERIWADLPVFITFPSEEELANIPYRSKKELSGKVRIVTIPESDICACCGTHVTDLGQIGIIKALTCSPHKGGTRVDILAGERAYEYLRNIWSNNREVARLLRCKEAETGNETQRVLNESLQKDIRRSKLMKEYVGFIVGDLPEQKLHILYEEEKTVNELRLLGNRILDEKKAVICALFSEGNDGYNYLILSNEPDLRPLCKQLNQKLNGRGGGSKEMVSGSFKAAREEIEAALKEVLDAAD
ncbi:MAG: hypothetical protein IKF18_04980 [Erysipelotrichaceae bacterium]|nr:hypothetical protein [Erysipelotrichaceae bacterium]